MAMFDQFREVAEEQRQQQGLDVGAVHVRIGHDDDLAVAQAGEVDHAVRLVRIHPQGHRDIVDFGVGKEAIGVDLPGVQYLAAQGQDGLRFLVARHLGRAAGGVALNEEEFVVGNVFGFAVRQLAG